MLCLYTTTKNIKLDVKVNVTGIDYIGERMVFIDMDEVDSYKVNYQIYPLNSANKNVEFKTEKVGDNKLAILEFVDGKIVPKSIGLAKVYLTTVDGGFRDSFIVKVDSMSVQEIECVATQYEFYVGESGAISTTFIPENAINKMLIYSSNNTQVATVDNNGKIRAVGKGSATITIASEHKPNVFDTISINVYNKNIMDLSVTEVNTIKNNGSVNISVDTNAEYEMSYTTKDLEKNEITGVLNASKTNFVINNLSSATFNYELEESFIGSAVVEITITSKNTFFEPFTKSFVINRVTEIDAWFGNEDALSKTIGSPFSLHNLLTISPEDADIRFELSQSEPILEVTELSKENGIRLLAKKAGVTTVTLKVISNVAPFQEVVVTKEIIVLPNIMEINEAANTYGIENVFTVGQYEADGTSNKTKLSLSFGGVELTNFTDYITYETDNDKVEISEDGTINILDENFVGMVKVNAKFSYKNVELKSSQFSLRCVGKGVNVRSFDDLYNASKQGKIIVLQTNVNNDFGYDKYGNAVYSESTVTKINSTYDTTHYKNIDKQDEAKIKVLISFTADVYGNGYSINSHNVAYALDATGQLKKDALFKGPLNFVSLSETGGGLVSVKAQDNISFAVYDNVTLNNITLSSANLTSDEQGNYDLSDLTYVGTTVEVLGDNVNIEYSRINNGRTVLRVFGDDEDSSKVINLNIKNSVLSSAREFIIRMGSNHFVNGTKDTPSPFLDENTSQQFPAQETYANMSEQQKAEYDAKYVKTFVNIKNSVLKDSGLFCIGMDAHFSGEALADGRNFLNGLISSWYDLAKTSYGAKLTFEGDVRMYDWKNINSIDSSTLIEVLGESQYANMAIDLKELINAAANDASKPHYQPIITEYNGSKYVHGGIAFFGGGKNYDVFEYKDYTFKQLGNYKIGLDDVNRVELQLAAGNEKFYFMLNDSTTQGFSPADQEEILNSGSAYAPIYS